MLCRLDVKNKCSLDIGELWFNGISLGKDSIIIEIGAYSGNISLFAVREFEIAHGYALEASPKNFETLYENCKNTSIVPLNFAIGKVDGFVPFYEYNNHSASNSLIVADGRFIRDTLSIEIKRKNIDVESITIASFITKYKIENIDLLIMNCEGSEIYILPQIIKDTNIINKIRELSIEFHPQLLGQRKVMRLIMDMSFFYKPRVITKSIRGPINVIFSRRAHSLELGIVWQLRYLKALLMDMIWPFLVFLKRYWG